MKDGSTTILGIDLGTTNSAVAAFTEAGPQVVMLAGGGRPPATTMPSVVGLAADGALLVGQAARNQAHLAPERTIVSVKRHMGEGSALPMGARSFTPVEVSALILGELRARAEAALGEPLTRAVITVPAYFADAQRQATREAGALAGLEVVRILNEPTAAALAYGGVVGEAGRVLVYDFGGGTFDVSVVRIESGVVEVEVSAGDNHLGGDDIDALMAAHLTNVVREQSGLVDLDPAARARILRAAEEAKIELSTAPFSTSDLDHLGEVGGRPVHLSYSWERHVFNSLIEPLIERTLALVEQAMRDAQLRANALDRILLVGGSTHIPAVRDALIRRLGRVPEAAVDPDACVALGAAARAGVEMGHAPRGVLVDVTPYTFGTVAVNMEDGVVVSRRFAPIIHRNTRLPARHSQVFFKLDDAQDEVAIEVFQGEKPIADDNRQVGHFTFDDLQEGSAAREGGLVVTFALDQDGVLDVEAHERVGGRRLRARVDNVLGRKSAVELRQARAHLEAALGEGLAPLRPAAPASADERLPEDAGRLLARAAAARDRATPADADEVRALSERLRAAAAADNPEGVAAATAELEDLLLYIET